MLSIDNSASLVFWFIRLLRIIAIMVAIMVPILMVLGYIWLSTMLIYALIQTYVYLISVYALYYLVINVILEHIGTKREALYSEAKKINGVKTDITLYWIKITFLVLLLIISGCVLSIIWQFFSMHEVFSAVKGIFFGISLGEWDFSLVRIIVGIGLFIIIYKITHWLQQYLTTNIFPLLTLQRGLYNAISTAIGYLGTLVGIYVMLFVMGISLSGLAYILGGLSIGIGLGLQPIIVNFVSGVIMLLERHIRRGDLLTVEGQEGTVKKISFRSTELLTRDRNTLIVPNSKFIAELVQNWSYNRRRIDINIGVAYGSNAKKIEKILLDCASESDYSLDEPTPNVKFLSYGSYALNFQLRIYVDDPNRINWAISDINFLIDKKFDEAGITIPFPQQEIHLVDESKKKRPAHRKPQEKP